MHCLWARVLNSIPRLLWILVLWVLVAVGLPSLAEAQIQLDRFFPSAVTVGAKGSVKAEGQFPSWPVSIVCDREDVRLSAGTKSGEIEFSVDDGALPGIAWVRLHDDSSATTILPLLIEREPVRLESEPNNQPVDLKSKVELPCWIAGRLEKSGDVDSFSIELKEGQTFVMTVRANQILGSPMDAVLQLADTRGNVLAQADDTLGLDPQLACRCPADGTYVVRLFAFPETPNSTIGFAGAATFVYVLRMTTDPTIDHALPLVISESGEQSVRAFGWGLVDPPQVQWAAGRSMISSLPGMGGWQWHDTLTSEASFVFESGSHEPATSAELPMVFSGHFQSPGEIDRVQFPVKSGQRYRATVHARRFGFEVDSVLRVVDPDSGKELASNDDASRRAYDAKTEFKFEKDSTVEVQVSDVVENHGDRTAYSVTVEPVLPNIELLLPADRFVVDRGKPLELKVAVNRTDGDDAAVRVWVEGLPEGAKCEPQTSISEEESGKLVTLKVDASECTSSQDAIQVVGQRLDSSGKPIGSKLTATFFASKRFRLSDCWLSVPANEKD